MKCDDEDTTARRGRGDEKINALIEERKNTDKRRKRASKKISKRIKQFVRNNKKTTSREKIKRML